MRGERGFIPPVPKRAGFTVVELMIVGIVMFSLIGGMSFALIQSGNQAWGRTEAQMASVGEAMRIISLVNQDVNTGGQASLVCTAGANGSVEFTQLRPPPLPPLTIRYERDAMTPDRLVRLDVNAGTTTVVASGITEFNPLSCTNGVVRLQLTTQVQTLGQPSRSHTVQSSLWARNP